MKEHHAVLVRDHPDISPADARHARPVKCGSIVLGYAVPQQGRRRAKLTGLQGRAAKRLKEIESLAAWRRCYGVQSPPGGFLAVLVDLLAVLDGAGPWRCTTEVVRQMLRRFDIDAPDEKLAGALAKQPRPGRLLSNAEAGKMVGFVEAELRDLLAENVIVTLEAMDEGAEQRASRRAARRRWKARLRNVAYRERKAARAKSVTPVAILQSSQSERDARIRERASRGTATLAAHTRVIAAIAAGASTPAAIAAAADLPLSTVRPLLSRIRGAGMIAKVSRGRYALPTSMEGQDHVEH